MHSRPAYGEVGLALIFAALGVVWIVGGLRLQFWDGFAPSSGFLPLIYGLLLTGLSGLIAVGLFFGMAYEEAEPQPIGKPLLVLAALVVCVVGLQAAGFGLSIFLLLAFIFVVVERLNVFMSVLVAAGTAAALLGIFKVWLGVPLPAGPWGF
jgi:putative tricarboxylic transport membrane protein